MSDWRECRVVRDKDGDLWGCDARPAALHVTRAQIDRALRKARP